MKAVNCGNIKSTLLQIVSGSGGINVQMGMRLSIIGSNRLTESNQSSVSVTNVNISKRIMYKMPVYCVGVRAYVYVIIYMCNKVELMKYC